MQAVSYNALKEIGAIMKHKVQRGHPERKEEHNGLGVGDEEMASFIQAKE